jgi:hypothetical protein
VPTRKSNLADDTRRSKCHGFMGVWSKSWDSWSGTVTDGSSQWLHKTPWKPGRLSIGPPLALALLITISGLVSASPISIDGRQSNGSRESVRGASPPTPNAILPEVSCPSQKFYFLPSASVRQPDRVDFIILILASFEDNIDPADHCIPVPLIRPAQWCQIRHARFACCQVACSSSCALSNECYATFLVDP